MWLLEFLLRQGREFQAPRKQRDVHATLQGSVIPLYNLKTQAGIQKTFLFYKIHSSAMYLHVIMKFHDADGESMIYQNGGM